jgi:hypothetical protein
MRTLLRYIAAIDDAAATSERSEPRLGQITAEKNAWLTPLNAAESQHEDSGWDNWRVDLDGKPVHGDDVDYHKGLHHHGDQPGVAGYNMKELFRLARSTVPSQVYCCYNVVTMLLHCCYNVGTLLLQRCYTSPSLHSGPRPSG